MTRKYLSVAPYISGTIYHMIYIYSTHMQKDNIFRQFFFFSKIWFLGSLGGKRKKMAENDKKILSVSLRTKEPLMIRL